MFVTGTFDDWGKTVKLDRVGDIFTKEVSLPTGNRIHYKVCTTLCRLLAPFSPCEPVIPFFCLIDSTLR